jgi:hypothetical protein
MNDKSNGTKGVTKDNRSSQALSDRDRKEILRLKSGWKVGGCGGAGQCKAITGS